MLEKMRELKAEIDAQFQMYEEGCITDTECIEGVITPAVTLLQEITA